MINSFYTAIQCLSGITVRELKRFRYQIIYLLLLRHFFLDIYMDICPVTEELNSETVPYFNKFRSQYMIRLTTVQHSLNTYPSPLNNIYVTEYLSCQTISYQ